MKTFTNICSAALIMGFLCSGTSCKKNDNASANSASPLLSLSAQQTTLSANGTTKVAASVSNLQSCCTMTYNWTTNTGTISESGTEVTFTAPASSAQCTITCSAKDNCGKISGIVN